jgi:hypothetical protein
VVMDSRTRGSINLDFMVVSPDDSWPGSIAGFDTVILNYNTSVKSFFRCSEFTAEARFWLGSRYAAINWARRGWETQNKSRQLSPAALS